MEHDASEAYISDITRPVKKLLNEYIQMEERLQNIIYKAYKLEDLTDEERLLVKEIDDGMLNYEMQVLLNNYGINDLTLTRKYDLSFRMMEEVKKEFIDRVKQLQESRSRYFVPNAY